MTEPKRVELNIEQVNILLDRIEQHKLIESDYPLIADLIRSLAWLSNTLEEQNITLHRLRKIFGFKTERTSNLPNTKPEDEKKSDETKLNTDGHNDEKDSVKNGSDENPSGDDKKKSEKGNVFL